MIKFDGFTQPVIAVGVVEDRKDPLKIGRCRVRWYGLYRDDKQRIPTESLPWAQPIISQGTNNQTLPSYKEGDMVVGLFFDSGLIQQPYILGVLHGFPEDGANPDLGFNDPTSDEDLVPTKQPRPPFMGTLPDELEDDEADEADETESEGKDPDALPGAGTAFGVLASEFNAARYPFDVNQDGMYDNQDAAILQKNLNKGFVLLPDGTVKFGGELGEVPTFPMSRYPLEPLLKFPDTNAFQLGGDEAIEHIQFQTLQESKGEQVVAPVAEHMSTGIGTDQNSVAEPISEPEGAYKAEYPFNKTMYTESGHVMTFDDTPNHERIEIAHRSGTFIEVQPTGRTVSKIKKDHYHFALDNLLVYAGKSASISAPISLSLLGGGAVNIKSDQNINHDCAKMNNNILEDFNSKIGGNVYIKMEGGIAQLFIENEVQIICKDKLSLIVEDDLLINGEKNIKISAINTLHLEGGDSLALVSGTLVGTNTPITSLGGIINGNINAVTAASALTVGTGIAPLPHTPAPDVSDNAEFTDSRFTGQAESPNSGSSGIKPGYILDGGGGVLWKPKSDTKPQAVSLSNSRSQHFLYEAVPTGDLENVTIQFLNEDGSVTSWNVVRPVHKRGRLIEGGRFHGIANGDRAHYVWRTVGSRYPQQMFLVIDNEEYFLIDAAVRHD